MEFWERLGFREDPFSTKPLTVRKEDVELLIGRDEEQIEFLSSIDSASEGIFVLSGVPGVGKTSFFNVQQYLLESGEAQFGPRLLSARQLCPVSPYDEPRLIAERCIQSLCKSIQFYCEITKTAVPKETSKIAGWINQRSSSGFSLGLSIMGNGGNFGRQVTVSSIKDTTYEGLVEVIEVMVSEIVGVLKMKGCFIVLDNIENLQQDELGDSLITFRDTLFSLPNIWWVLIGQAGLYSQIETIDPRVSQRITASIELKPISVESLIQAVDTRVKRFHDKKDKGSSPIPSSIYTKLFKSSNGEIRFVFKYCHDICLNVVNIVRQNIDKEKLGWDDKTFDSNMGEYFVEKQLTEKVCNNSLKEIIARNFNGLKLSDQMKSVLLLIGKKESVSASDFKDFKDLGVNNQNDFIQNFLIVLRDKNLVYRSTEGNKVKYALRGIAIFALEYELLK